MGVPKQRGAGQFGGDRHRSNKGAFRASGGHVKPPSRGCLVLVIPAVTVPVGAVWGGLAVFL